MRRVTTQKLIFIIVVLVAGVTAVKTIVDVNDEHKSANSNECPTDGVDCRCFGETNIALEPISGDWIIGVGADVPREWLEVGELDDVLMTLSARPHSNLVIFAEHLLCDLTINVEGDGYTNVYKIMDGEMKLQEKSK